MLRNGSFKLVLIEYDALSVPANPKIKEKVSND